ncbi:MAG: PLP-dependent aminotransferase family protein [Eubacteriales bacterium]|nr:PLP-dependent aminotransferase family protein [Eubacteriales bacterium]
MQDLVIEFKDDGSHLYEQIYRHIKEEIRKGKLLYQEKLPSTRSLAAYLQVSRSTVELAYEQLVSEGYLEAVPYKGYFAARVEELYRLDSVSPGADEAAGRTAQAQNVRNARKAGNEQNARDAEAAPAPAVDFSPNAIDMRSFPFGLWRRISKNVMSQDNMEIFSAGNARGDSALRGTIARYLHASRGVNCSPEQIIVGAGNDFLLLLLRYILGEGICAAFENPTYPRAWRIFELFAGRMETVPSDEGGILVEELERTGAQVVYVMPTHQYPTGRVMPAGRRNELLNWAARMPGRYVIEDDYDSEFRYWGKPIPSLQSSDPSGRVIYIGTFSKSIAPAIRVSFLVLPRELLARYEERCSCFSSTVSRIDQAVLNEFIAGGAFERHLNRMRKVYSKKHELLLEGLRPFGKDFLLTGENAGLHVVLADRRGRSERQLRERALRQGVRVYGMSEALVGTLPGRSGPGKAAGSSGEAEPPEAPGSASVLLGFGGLTGEEIREGLERLRTAWLSV